MCKVALFQMNCSSLAIVTPHKVLIREKKLKPLKLVPNTRFSLSEEHEALLSKVDRVHHFQYHKRFEFKDLPSLGLTQNDVSELRNLVVNTKPDISDLVLTIEEVVIENKKYNGFIKQYIAEEFQIDSHYGFLCFCTLNYSKMYKISISEALYELLDLSSSESLCPLCIEGEDENGKVIMSRRHNLAVFNRDRQEQVPEAVCDNLVDSSSDCSFKVSKSATLETESSEDIKSVRICKPSRISRKFPLEKIHDRKSNGLMNSTELFNP